MINNKTIPQRITDSHMGIITLTSLSSADPMKKVNKHITLLDIRSDFDTRLATGIQVKCFHQL